MTKGRKALPNAVKVLRGTDQPCRMNNELSVTPITDFISSLPKNSPLKTKRAKKIYKEKANQLISLRVLTLFDLEQLAIYAYALDQAYTCMEELENKGLFYEQFDDNGNILRYVENPYMKLLREMIDITNKIGSDYGFIPVSRQKLKPSDSETSNPFADLLNLV